MSEIVDKIRSAGYFGVSITPEKFVPQRVQKVTELFPIIDRCHVEVRGWDFPHINRREAVVPDRPDSISQETEWQHHLEAWRFFQSGQFTDLRGFPSDWLDQYPGGRPTGTNWKKGELLFIEHVLFAFAETFQFAARLSNTAAGDERMSVEITVGGLMNRRLSVADVLRVDFIGGSPQAKMSEYPQTLHLSKAQLLSDTEALTISTSQTLFGIFGKELSSDLLRDWLRQLLRR